MTTKPVGQIFILAHARIVLPVIPTWVFTAAKVPGLGNGVPERSIITDWSIQFPGQMKVCPLAGKFD